MDVKLSFARVLGQLIVLFFFPRGEEGALQKKQVLITSFFLFVTWVLSSRKKIVGMFACSEVY